MVASNNNLIKNIPTHLFLGFLGVGKTSVILKCFKNKPVNEKWAVVVNEFGKLGIDGKIYQSQGVMVKEVPGGCLCCAVGLPFQVAINQILKEHRPDRLLIESSGASHADGVLKTLHQPSFEEALDLKAVVCLIDPRHLLDERYFGNSNYQTQLSVADLLLATKVDLATDEALCKFDQLGAFFEHKKLKIEQLENNHLPLEWLNNKHSNKQKIETKNHALKNQFSSKNWQFSAHDLFSIEPLSSWLQQALFVRAKAIVNTNIGWVIFNSVDGKITQESIHRYESGVIEVVFHEASQHSNLKLESGLLNCKI